MSRSSSASSSCSSNTRAVYGEIYRTRSYLDGLSQLPRPQATIEDAHFLTYYSLQAQKLALTDILSHCSLTYVDPLEEFPSKTSSHSSVLFHKEEGTVVPIVPYNPRLHLNKKLLVAKQQQLQSLMYLYEREVQWLSLGSRLWFGPVRGRHVAFLIDFSDSICFSHYTRYLSVLHVLVDEQIVMMDRVYLFAVGTETSEPAVFDMRETDHTNTSKSIKDWMTSIRAQGSCNLLSGLKKVLKLRSKIDTVAVLLCSRPNQKLSIIYDHLVQLTAGLMDAPHFHITTINTEQDIQVSLSRLVKEVKGHYHQLTFDDDKPLLEDTLTNEINSELSQAHEVFRQLENIKKNVFEEFLLEALRQLSVVSEWPRDDTFTPPTSPTHHPPSDYTTTTPQASGEWLKRRGLDSCGLNLYQFLAPDAYSQLSEYVSLIDKSALSSVYDLVMPQFMWNDSSYKYLHVDVHRLNGYVTDMRQYIEFLEKRMSWLISGSRVPFGNIAEKRVIVLIDTSVTCGLQLTQLQQHMKILLHEQVSKLDAFNIVSMGESVCQWSSCLVPPTKVSLTEAWKWVLHIDPKGTCNLLEALRQILENPEYNNSRSDFLGLYIIISSMPDQTEISLRSYLEQKLAGRKLNLHLIYYQPTVPNRWAEITLQKGSGHYGDTQAIVQCLKHIAGGNLVSYHQFSTGESNDHQLLERELVRANSYLDTVQNIVDDYKDCYCKRSVPALIETKIERQRPKSAPPPVYPRPTLTSVARLNSTAMKLKEKDTVSYFHVRRPKRKGPFLTCHCFYLGRGLKKGLFNELEFENCSQCKKPLIPSSEDIMSTGEWLSKYSLKQLHLYNKRMFTNCKDGYKHVTSDGHVVELNVSHQQLNKLLKQLRIVRTRYFDRLQWLLTDSRYVFGCVTGKKVVILFDASSSMKEHGPILKEQLVTLIKEQFTRKRISSFNIIAFATEVLPWQLSLVPNTAENRSKVEEWIQRLKFGGCSNLYEAIKLSLLMRVQSIYLVSDGDTDHTSAFLTSQIKDLRKRFSFPWNIHTLAYQSTKQECLELLQTLARLTKGRYGFYPVRHLNSSTILANSKTLNVELHLGDDLKLLVDEILLADSAIKQSLHHLGR